MSVKAKMQSIIHRVCADSISPTQNYSSALISNLELSLEQSGLTEEQRAEIQFKIKELEIQLEENIKVVYKNTKLMIKNIVESLYKDSYKKVQNFIEILQKEINKVLDDKKANSPSTERHTYLTPQGFGNSFEGESDTYIIIKNLRKFL